MAGATVLKALKPFHSQIQLWNDSSLHYDNCQTFLCHTMRQKGRKTNDSPGLPPTSTATTNGRLLTPPKPPQATFLHPSRFCPPRHPSLPPLLPRHRSSPIPLPSSPLILSSDSTPYPSPHPHPSHPSIPLWPSLPPSLCLALSR